MFVEWSKANELVQDVNYPSNMLYSAALRAAGTLYGDDAFLQKAEKVKEEVLRQSFDGSYFVDNAVRGEDGALHLSGERTEVCQYYAFFCGIATPQSHEELFKTLVRDFGPERHRHNRHPEIYFANAFIGNYLRLDILMRYGYRDAGAQKYPRLFPEYGAQDRNIVGERRGLRQLQPRFRFPCHLLAGRIG